MKRTFALLFVTGICVAAAKAGDVKVDVVMTTSPNGEPTTSFTADAPKLFALFKTKGATNGDKARGVLFADDVGDAAPANTKVFETSLTLEGDTEDGGFNFSKPTTGWPVGKYHVEIYVNDELATKVQFTIRAAKVKKSQEQGEEESSDE
jgi:hypothetical protein